MGRFTSYSSNNEKNCGSVNLKSIHNLKVESITEPKFTLLTPYNRLINLRDKVLRQGI